MDTFGGYVIGILLVFAVIGFVWKAVNKEGHEQFKSNTKEAGLDLLTRWLKK